MTSTMRGGFNDCQRFSGVVGCNVSGDGRRLKDQVLPDVVREPAAVIESLVVAQSFLYDGIGRALRELVKKPLVAVSAWVPRREVLS